MNTHLGIIGTKLGMTQLFLENGELLPCTVVQAGCIVVGKRTQAKDGYTALQLGFGTKRKKLVKKPQLALYEKLGVEPPSVVREFRVTADIADKYEVGQALKPSDVFTEGQIIDVSGTSKGRGFAGVMKRHNFSGAGTVGHGTHEYKRHGGSIGMNMTPGHTLKGQRMAGQYGNKRITTQNIEVVRVDTDRNLILVKGAVPGARGGDVVVTPAIKLKNKG